MLTLYSDDDIGDMGEAKKPSCLYNLHNGSMGDLTYIFQAPADADRHWEASGLAEHGWNNGDLIVSIKGQYPTS